MSGDEKECEIDAKFEIANLVSRSDGQIVFVSFEFDRSPPKCGFITFGAAHFIRQRHFTFEVIGSERNGKSSQCHTRPDGSQTPGIPRR
jgi:hypothetical protein